MSSNTPVEIIADIGAAHGGDPELAIKLAKSAIMNGASVVKGQIGISELTRHGHKLHETFSRLELEEEAWEVVASEVEELGGRFTCSCWSISSVLWLATMNPPFIKIGSGDATSETTLVAARATGLPVYLSVGLCTAPEVSRAVSTIGDNLGALLACTVAYPARVEEAYLSRIHKLREYAPVRIGYSSHVPSWKVPALAAQLGASVLEVHHAFSHEDDPAALLPADLSLLCSFMKSDVRNSKKFPAGFVWQAVGPAVGLGTEECEKPWLNVARRNPETGFRE